MENLDALEESLQNKKQKKAPWDNESYNTEQLYGSGNRPQKVDDNNSSDTKMEPVADSTSKEPSTQEQINITKNKAEDGFTVVGSNGKVRWQFLITADTTNKEIDKTRTSKLLQAVTIVGKQLAINLQPKRTPIGPREQAC